MDKGNFKISTIIHYPEDRRGNPAVPARRWGREGRADDPRAGADALVGARAPARQARPRAEALGALGGDGVDARGDREHRPRDCRAGVAAAGDGGGADARVHPRHREPGGRADRKNRAPGGD